MASIITKIIDSLFLMRLPLLAPVWTVMALGWIAGSPDARIGGVAYGALFVNLFGFSLLVASIYVVNQIQDIESDRINRKLFLLPRGMVSIPAAWALAAVCAAAGLAVAFVQGAWMFALFLAGFVAGVLYNLPPAALRNRPVGGAAANSLGHGAITFLAGWLSAKGGADMTAQTALSGLLSAAAPFFANGAVFLATTIPDAPGDSRTGKRTFCVAYGERATAAAAAVMCALALGASFLIESHFWVMAVPAALSLGVFVHFAVTARKRSAFYSFKWPVFLLSAFVALFVPVYGALVVVTFLASRVYYRRRFGIAYPTFGPE